MAHAGLAKEEDVGDAARAWANAPLDGGPRRPGGLAVAPVPLQDEHSHGSPVVAPQGGCGRSRAEQISELLGRPETYGDLNVEFKLFVRLLLAGGRMAGTWEDIAKRLASDARNVKAWAGKLEKNGRVVVAETGRRRVEVMLCEPYLGVATAKEEVETRPVERPVEDDPDLVDLIRAYRTAKLTGSVMEVTSKRVFTNGKSA